MEAASLGFPPPRQHLGLQQPQPPLQAGIFTSALQHAAMGEAQTGLGAGARLADPPPSAPSVGQPPPSPGVGAGLLLQAPSVGPLVPSPLGVQSPLQAPVLGPLVPSSAQGPLQVLPEDCQAGGGLPAPPPSGGQQTKTRSKKVYLQNDRDASLFKKVSKDQVRRSRDARKEGSGAAGGGVNLTLASTTMPRCVPPMVAARDPDASRLQLWDPQDAEICDLLTRARLIQTKSVVFFFVVQAALAGLAVATGSLVLGALGDPDSLALVLTTLKPGLNRVTLAMAEVSLVGSLLRASRTAETISVLSAATGGVSFGDTTGGGGDPAAGRRAAMRLGLGSALHAAANAALVGCCLLGTYNDVLLLHGPWPGSDGWLPEYAQRLLMVQSLLGLAGLGFALPEVTALIFGRPDGPVAALSSGVDGSGLSGSKTAAALDSSLLTLPSLTSLR